jgi:two-component system chemotaxis response regulator CheB
VILSGLLDDGALGLRQIKEEGGAAIVQDPDDAPFSSMPLAAIEATAVDRVVPLAELAEALVEMVGVPVGPLADCEADGELDQLERDPTSLVLVNGPPTPLSCPACGGALWEAVEGPVLRFTCQIGHAYSQESMLDAQGAAVERAMWAALRALEERAELLRRIARRQSGASRARLEQRAGEVEEQARNIRAVLLDQGAEPLAEGRDRMGPPGPTASGQQARPDAEN